MLSSYDAKSAFAPPASTLTTSTTSLPSLYFRYVQPFLDANNLESTNNRALIGYRAVAQGPRTDDYLTTTQNYTAGVDGKAWGWDYNARLNSGIGVTTDTMAGGYLGFTCFNAAIATDQYDPIVGTGSESVARCILGSEVSRSKSTLNSLHLSGQHEFFELSGGPAIVALGADYYQQKYSGDFSSLAQANSGFEGQPSGDDRIVGGTLQAVGSSASRNNWGIYGERYLPILKSLEATASVRYDSYDKVQDKMTFSSTLDPVTGLYMRTGDADAGTRSPRLPARSASAGCRWKACWCAVPMAPASARRALPISPVCWPSTAALQAPIRARFPVPRNACPAAPSTTCCWVPTDSPAKLA